MSDISPVESAEIPTPNSLKSLENKNFADLPQEVRVGDKGLMTTFRLVSERTKTTNTEWSAYITKDSLGTLSPQFLRPGDEDEARSVEFRDLTGFEKEDFKVGFRTIVEGEKWREDNPDTTPMTLFGRDLDLRHINKSLLHKGVVLVPHTEFFALVHSHRGRDVHSPADAYMLAEQPFRPDGRPDMPISIVIGPEEFYALVAPKDGNVKRTGYYRLPEGVLENLILGTIMTGLSDEEKEKKIYAYVENLSREKRLGFYKGSLKDGVLKRVV